jgi:hypothetical protein
MGAVPARFGNDFDALALVLLDRQLRGVEEDGVPASGKTGRDDVPLWAVVQMQGGRDRDPAGIRRPHREHGVDAGHLHVLDRRLDDDRSPQLLGGREDGLHREVVDDVDRGHAVTLREGTIEDGLGRYDRHLTTSRRDASPVLFLLAPGPDGLARGEAIVTAAVHHRDSLDIARD